jgi:hypothetical protein
MSDIFGYDRGPKARGVFSSENSSLNFGSAGSEPGFLVQNWNVTYTQQVQELFEIGSNALYWAKGRPVGNGTIGRIVGDKGVATAVGLFPTEAYDICHGGEELVLSATGGHCESGAYTEAILNQGVKLTMDGCAVTQVGYSMQVADVRLMENYGWRFAYLQVEEG